ncbi:MAG: leucine-rich repeat protein [Oscillospiraceae bacterium]|nr:leucine-rich repeat protein [Oscillospiraceae bacterium]
MKKSVQICLCVLMLCLLGSCFLGTVYGRMIPRVENLSTDSSCGENMTWSYNTNTKVLTISGKGEMWGYSNGGHPWNEYRSQIVTVNVGSGVTYITAQAFAGCTSLKTVSLPASLTNLGYQVFDGCTSLTDIKVNSSNKSFCTDGAGALYDYGKTYVYYAPSDISGTYTLPDTVESVAYKAFTDCAGLEKLVFSPAMRSISGDSFPQTLTFKTIEVPSSNTYFYVSNKVLINKNTKTLVFCPRGFSGAYSVPSGVQTIDKNAFYECQGLSSVTMSEGVTSIKDYAFYNCDGLVSATLPDSLTTIGKEAFSSCGELSSIRFGSGLQSIGDYAFHSVAITELSLPEGLTTVGYAAFQNCTKLLDAKLPNSLTELPYYMFYNCTNLTKVALGESLTYISDYAFKGAKSLVEISFGNKLTGMGKEVFYGCSALTSVSLPHSLKSTGTGCFYKCTSLTAVQLSNSMSYIQDETFYGCSRLASISFGSGLRAIYEDAFYGTSALKTLTIPEGVEKLYASAFQSSGIKYIRLPSSLTYIGTYCFDNSSIEHVLYGGTEAQWANVTCKDTHKIFSSSSFHTEGWNTQIQFETRCNYTNYSCGQCKGRFGYTAISAPEHSFDHSGTCVKCLAPSYLEYKFHPTYLTMTVTGFDDSVDDVIIPDCIDEIPVVTIGQKAFANSHVRSVVFGCHITTVEAEAFNTCEQLSSVIFSPVLATMGDYAIAHCPELMGLKFPNTLVELGMYALYDNTSLRKVDLGQGITTIGNGSFYGCASLETVLFGQSLQKIGNNAFANCNKLNHVSYAGGSQQYQSIEIGSNNSPLSSAYFHYNTVSNPVRFTTTCQGYYSSCELCMRNLRYTLTEGAEHLWYEGQCVLCDVPSYLKYSISQNCQLSVTGYDKSVIEILIPETIEFLPVYTIASNAFSFDSQLERVSLPASLNSMGAGCFQYATALRQVSMQDGLQSIGVASFTGCTALEEMILPHSVTSLGGSAFRDCTGLKKVVLSDKLTTIDTYVFKNCASLEEITVPSGLKYIWDEAFYDCDSLTEVVLPDTFTTFGQSAFYDCDGLRTMEVGANLVGINIKAFYDCDSLQAIVIPNTCILIDQYAFYHCDSLERAEIGAQKIQYYAFSECAGLTDLVLAEGVLDIYCEAFSYCPQLNRVALPTTLHWVEGYVFHNSENITRVDITDVVALCGVKFSNLTSNPTYYGDLYINGELAVNISIPEDTPAVGDYAFVNCKSLESVSLPFYATRIGVSAFAGCSSLKKIYIPPMVTELGDYAFYDCLSLRSAEVSADITAIPEGLFAYCTSLMSVTVPDTVTEIGKNSFYLCKNLRSINIPSGVTRIREYAFDGCKMLNHILYAGNTTAWNKITRERENDELTIAIIHYNASAYAVSWKYVGTESYLYCSICNTALTEKPYCFHDNMRLYFDCLPTCTEPGYTGDVICLICNEVVEKGQSIPPLNHPYQEYTGAVAPTCTEPGYTGELVCTRCNQLMAPGEPIPALNHSETHVEGELPSTCTQDGYTGDVICDLCGILVSPGMVIPSAGHREAVTLNYVPSGCVTDGYSGDLVCPVCGEVFSYGQVLPAVGRHTTDIVNAYPATCEEEGYSGDQVCIECGEFFSAGEPIPPQGHNYAAGICQSCGRTDPNYSVNPFEDVSEREYYFEPVKWAVEWKITTGINANTFAPENPCTRAQIVTFLWRAFGSPEPATHKNPFKDVTSDAYYYKAVLWAVENNITTGINATTFGPEVTCTRGQVVTFLWRSQGKPRAEDARNSFIDVNPGDYFADAVLWAVEAGITNGTGRGMFSPDGNCTRGQIVTFLYRAMK